MIIIIMIMNADRLAISYVTPYNRGDDDNTEHDNDFDDDDHNEVDRTQLVS